MEVKEGRGKRRFLRVFVPAGICSPCNGHTGSSVWSQQTHKETGKGRTHTQMSTQAENRGDQSWADNMIISPGTWIESVPTGQFFPCVLRSALGLMIVHFSRDQLFVRSLHPLLSAPATPFSLLFSLFSHKLEAICAAGDFCDAPSLLLFQLPPPPLIPSLSESEESESLERQVEQNMIQVTGRGNSSISSLCPALRKGSLVHAPAAALLIVETRSRFSLERATE